MQLCQRDVASTSRASIFFIFFKSENVGTLVPYLDYPMKEISMPSDIERYEVLINS